MSLEKALERMDAANAELTSTIRALNDNMVDYMRPGDVTPPSPFQDDTPEPPAGPTKDDVIAALKSLQAVTDSGAVKDVLAQFGAPSVGKLDPSDYAGVYCVANDQTQRAAQGGAA